MKFLFNKRIFTIKNQTLVRECNFDGYETICHMKIQLARSYMRILGMPFFQSIYPIFDRDNFKIGLAHVPDKFFMDPEEYMKTNTEGSSLPEYEHPSSSTISSEPSHKSNDHNDHNQNNTPSEEENHHHEENKEEDD